MPNKKKCRERVIAKDMRKMSSGKLKSGSGSKVKSRAQALAIGYSQAREKCPKRKRR